MAQPRAVAAGAHLSTLLGVGALVGFILAITFLGGTAPSPVAASNHTVPTAALTVDPNPAHPGETVVVDASASSDPDGEPVTCTFDLDGDGEIDRESQECVVETRYELTGEVQVTVRVFDPSGQFDEAMETLQVTENTPPSASVTHHPDEPDPGEEVRFDATDSIDEDGTITEYRWDLDGDGEVDRVDGPTTRRTFDEAGEYAISVTVVDDDGATATTTVSIPVRENRPPTAVLAVDPRTIEPDQVLRLMAGESSDPDGTIVEWAFDLDGDGRYDQITERPRVTASYADAGDYTVGLRVTDNDGATATASSTVVVTGASTATPTTETVVRTVVVTAGPPSDRLGIPPELLGLLDGSVDGLVPLALGAVLMLLAGLIGVTAVRGRSAVSRRVRAIARKVKRQLTPRKIASRLGKRLIKKGLRKLGETIERSGDVSGRGIEAIGNGVRRVTKRIGRTLKRWGA